MEDSAEGLELKSDKVRSIIGQIPPWIIRSGISVLLLIVTILLIGSYYFKYPYQVTTVITFTKVDSVFVGIVKIPANEITKISKGQEVEINFDHTKYTSGVFLKSSLGKISKELTISDGSGFYTARIDRIEDLKVVEETVGKAIIITDEISFFERIISPFSITK